MLIQSYPEDKILLELKAAKAKKEALAKQNLSTDPFKDCAQVKTLIQIKFFMYTYNVL